MMAAGASAMGNGYIQIPAAEPPYFVLWALFRSGDGRNTGFRPPYCEVLFIDV